jgi:hypothetical protein
MHREKCSAGEIRHILQSHIYKQQKNTAILQQKDDIEYGNEICFSGSL